MLYHLPAAQGWAIYNWSIESDPNFNADRLSPAYIGQEAARIGEGR